MIDLRTLRPLDKATVLESLKRTNRMVVVEEGWPTCSISSEIIAIAMTEGFDDLDAPVLRVTDVDVPLPYAANLEKMALIKAVGSRRGGEGGHAIAERRLDPDRSDGSELRRAERQAGFRRSVELDLRIGRCGGDARLSRAGRDPDGLVA